MDYYYYGLSMTFLFSSSLSLSLSVSVSLCVRVRILYNTKRKHILNAVKDDAAPLTKQTTKRTQITQYLPFLSFHATCPKHCIPT
ncbi:hypothetical protein J3F83DRAFT_265707 [Trichoderma novae-zelandiae]